MKIHVLANSKLSKKISRQISVRPHFFKGWIVVSIQYLIALLTENFSAE